MTSMRLLTDRGHRAGAVGPGTGRLVDLGLAAVGAAGELTEALVRHPHGTSPAAYLLVLLVSGPLVVRTVWPLATLLVIAAGAVLCAAALDASWVASFCVAAALYTVALLGDRRRSLVVGVATSVLVIVAVLAIDGTIDVGGVASRLALVIVCVAAGEVIRTRQELGVARRDRAEQAAREHAEALRRAAADERLAIARELHDSLGHFLVAINVRASVAVEVPENQDPSEALIDIKQVSANALADLRTTLSALRDDDDLAPTAPASGLEALSELVARASSAGVDTTLELTVDAGSIPPATSAATVRIVQESLTNVIRHAHASQAQVAVTGTPGMLAVSIIDNGTASGPPSPDGGFGLRGMRERATALGGQLDAGPQPRGGWAVTAWLPLIETAMP